SWTIPPAFQLRSSSILEHIPSVIPSGAKSKDLFWRCVCKKRPFDFALCAPLRVTDRRQFFQPDPALACQTEPLAAIGPAHHALPPAAMVEVPAHGGAEAVVEIVPGPPAQLAPDLRGVDGVALVVPRPVGDEFDQPLVRASGAVGQ